jgi:hypothetical protein
MKRSTLATLLGLALVAAPAANAAEPLSYSYIEANYVDTNADIDDGLDASANGFGFNGSIAFGDTGLYGFAGYDTVGDDFDGIDIDINRTTAGLGHALAIDEGFHWTNELSYVDYELEVAFDGDSGSVSADGYRFATGLRGMMADNIEGIAKIGYINVEEDGLEIFDGAYGELGIRWHIDKAWSAGLLAEIAQDEVTYKLGGRLSW